MYRAILFARYLSRSSCKIRALSLARCFYQELELSASRENCELPHPTALGPGRPSLVAGGASCFRVGTCIRPGHSGSRLRRRLPFTGGSECPTPTDWTPTHNRRCALSVALEHRRRRGEHRTTPFDRRGSKCGGERVCEPCGAVSPPYSLPPVAP